MGIQDRPHFNPTFFLRAPSNEPSHVRCNANRISIFDNTTTSSLFAISSTPKSLKGKILAPDRKAVPGARVHLFDARG